MSLIEEPHEVQLLLAADAEEARRQLLQFLEHAVLRVSFDHRLGQIE